MSDKKVTYESEMNRLDKLENAWQAIETYGDTEARREEAKVEIAVIGIMKNAMVNPQE